MPDFSPLLQSSFIIQIHAYAAIFALCFGGYVLWAKKGNRRHRIFGKIWVFAMLIVAISSFWITSSLAILGPFSFIHILSVLTLVSISLGVKAAREKRISTHMKSMRSLYLYALIGAGIFTFLPGRLMYSIFFG